MKPVRGGHLGLSSDGDVPFCLKDWYSYHNYANCKQFKAILPNEDKIMQIFHVITILVKNHLQNKNHNSVKCLKMMPITS